MPYSGQEIKNIVEAQRSFFKSGKTLDVSWRRRQLILLKNAVIKNEELFKQALAEDLSRSSEEAYFCDIGASIMEINEMIAGLSRWARPKLHFSGLVCFPSLFSKVTKMPYGVTLIISPFNFPLLLTAGPLAAAIAGGNTAVVKLSSKSKACSSAIKKVLEETFPPEYIAVIDGGHEEADMCLSQRFDKIFYTGSPKVGRHVLSMAAENLTPAALELGGETGNWCVVRADADLRDAAEKIAFFKMCNSGQICIDINQVAVAEEVADEFITELKAAFVRQIGPDALINDEYPRMISREAFGKCCDIAGKYKDRIVFGGGGDENTLRFRPTLIYPVKADEDIVMSELFNPLLPLVPYKDSEADFMMDIIASREHGLALYIFTKDVKWAKKVMAVQQFGGGCINEVCMHIMAKGVPFGGCGHSGMGAYHGVWGFNEFTHPCTVLLGSTRFNLPLRKHPYGGARNSWKLKLIRFFEK